MINEKVKTHLSLLNLTKPLTIKEIIALEVKSRGLTKFRKWNATKDVATGIIGDRGTGKSVSEGLLGLTDYMMVLEPCYSNEKISVTLDIDDSLEKTIQEYETFTGMPILRQPVKYESQELDITRLLSSNPPYTNGVIVVDEFNIEMADAWRTTTNQSLATSDFMQLLRKLKSAFIFSCISEMFVPNRVRDAVDIYIQTRDLAFINNNPYYGDAQGKNWEWKVFAMTDRVAGSSFRYDVLKKPFQTVHLHGKKYWGIIDTWAKKERKKHISSLYGNTGQDVEEASINVENMQITESKNVRVIRMKWGWLLEHPLIKDMLATGEILSAQQILDALAPDVPIHLGKKEVLDAFETYLNPDSKWSGGKKVYWFGVFDRGRRGRERASVIS